ncbi:MAG: MBL fold metallo-hydrolase [Dehalococcoidia bacterium]|nr:MBL fold metallo-hydrolase [Dehalococcoidia bacterium]
MAEAVAEGAWWLHGTRGCNVFLVRTGDALVLIDTGFASSLEGIVRDVATVAPGEAVTHVLLTHAHPDHAGAAEALRQHYGARLVAGAGDCEVVSGRAVLREAVGRSHRMRRLLEWWRGTPRAHVVIEEPLEGERRVAGLLAVPTPGHTPGSYCYVLEHAGLAFVGDLVISHRDGLARPLKWANDDDARYLETLATFAARAPEAGCAGHGPPVTSGFRAQLLGLSRLPRRNPWSPRGAVARLRRLRSFGGAISRKRDTSPEAPD